MKPVVLVIGFGPFPGAPVNPSAALVRSLRKSVSSAHIVTHILPTEYRAVAKTLPALIRKHNPDAVLMFGLAGCAKAVRIETKAVNVRAGKHKDASGKKPLSRSVIRGAPRVLKAAAPVAALVAAAKSAGVNAVRSGNAGRYICNASLYTCLDLRRRTGRPPLVAFVHIPWTRGARPDGSPVNPTLPTAAMLKRAGKAILKALIAVARPR